MTLYRVASIKTWYGTKWSVRNEENQVAVLRNSQLAWFDHTKEGLLQAKTTAKELNEKTKSHRQRN